MSSAVFDKLRGLLRRAPDDAADLDRPTLDWNPTPRKLDALTRELDRVATRQAELEARLAGTPTSAITPATPTAGDLARIDAAIATLQARCAELAGGQSSMAAALKRADEAVGVVDADREEIVHQLSALHAATGRDGGRLDELQAGLRTLRTDLAAAMRRWESLNLDSAGRAEDLSRRIDARLGPPYLISLLALIVALAAMGLVISRS